MLRVIQIASYVVGILSGLAAPVLRVTAMDGMAPHVMLYVSMTCFLCSIATKFVAEAIEEPKEAAKSRATAA